MIDTYKKKPVIIEAVQWNGNNEIEIMGFVGARLAVSKPPYQMQHDVDLLDSHYLIIIPTLEGDMTASRGDYIIKGVKGEFYPCKPDIFLLTYELVVYED